MKTFKISEELTDLEPCIKRPVIIHAKKMEEEFRIMTSDGNYREGQAGDYLMRGTDGDLFICQNLIFEKIYEFVQ